HDGSTDVEHTVGCQRPYGLGERVVVAQVANDQRVRALEVGEPPPVGAGSHQRMHLGTAVHLVSRDMGTDEPSGASDEDRRQAKYRYSSAPAIAVAWSSTSGAVSRRVTSLSTDWNRSASAVGCQPAVRVRTSRSTAPNPRLNRMRPGWSSSLTPRSTRV